MTDASLPVWSLVLIPIGAAALGAASGPVTEKFRSDSESRNRAADRAAVAKARSDETQQATIVQLLAAMNALEKAANRSLWAEVDEKRAAAEALGEALNVADALRVLVADEEARRLTWAAMEAIEAAASGDDIGTLQHRIDTATGALREAT